MCNHRQSLWLRGEKVTWYYKLKSRDGRGISTMSYDDRMTVVRCRTILDEVLRRRTIIDEVTRRRRTTIAQISCDEPRRRTMSCEIVRDVVRHRTIILGYPTWTRIAASFWTWSKTAKTSRDWPPMTATSSNVVQRRATLHDLPPDNPRSP